VTPGSNRATVLLSMLVAAKLEKKKKKKNFFSFAFSVLKFHLLSSDNLKPIALLAVLVFLPMFQYSFLEETKHSNIKTLSQDKYQIHRPDELLIRQGLALVCNRKRQPRAGL